MPDVRLEGCLARLGSTLNVRLAEFLARRYSGAGPAAGTGPPPTPWPDPTTAMSSDTELVACYWSLGEADDRAAHGNVAAASPAGVPARGDFFDRCESYGRLYDRFARGKTPLDRGAFIRRCLDDREFFMSVVEALFREEDGSAAPRPSVQPGRPAFAPGPSRPAMGARPGRAIELD